jgi:hypothetical protein
LAQLFGFCETPPEELLRFTSILRQTASGVVIVRRDANDIHGHGVLTRKVVGVLGNADNWRDLLCLRAKDLRAYVEVN